MTKVRETKRADELKPGDWTAPGGISALPAEVLHAITYPHPGTGYQQPGDSGLRSHLVLREFEIALPFSETYAADWLVEIATAEELESFRAGAERAKKIADIRAFADWLEANPAAPVPWSIGGQVAPGHEVRPDLDVWNSGAEGMAELRRIAELMGAEIVQDDERATATKTFGCVDYRVIAWHKDGRPAEGLVDETPIAAHYDATVPGDVGEVCACGKSFAAPEQLDRHIAAANGKPSEIA